MATQKRERRVHWEHRVVRHHYECQGKEIEWYGIHETFYGGMLGKKTREISWTKYPNDVTGETVKELRGYLRQMLGDLRSKNRRGILDCTNCSVESCGRSGG